ncbi:MAG: response regulator [Bacteriovoracaceae bacterium]|nr:response regulator [Bacteriovoracaceae bacterium]
MGAKEKLRVVVVDDSEFSRQSTVEILNEDGFSVIGSFGSAEEVLSFLRTGEADLYLIDVVMPDMSGIELAKEVSGMLMETYIIMMSSLNTESIVIESISNGAIDFLPKPFEKEDLLNAVNKIVRDIEKG